jgi:hypothetical protein
MTMTMRALAARLVLLLLACLLVGWTVGPVCAQMSRERDSSRSSRDRSSRGSDFDDDDDDDDDSRRSSRSSRSSARSSRDSGGFSGSARSRSSSRSSSSRRSGSSMDYEPPAIVFGDEYERVGVRPRGNLVSEEAFEAFSCTVTTVMARGTPFYRCGDRWFNRVEHEGWISYSEVFPPAGVTVTALPKDAQVTRAGGRTLYATSEAFYEAVRDPSGTRYVVVEPEVGWVIDRLPPSAKFGIPVRSGRHDYYRHLGVFYREDKSTAAVRYVASASPFAAEAPAATSTQEPPTPVAAAGR